MATVTGLTKDAMEAIRDGVIVDAEVVGNNLILTKFDATTIDAGNVRGPTGAGQPSVVTSLPSSPTDLDEVYYQTAAMATAKVMWRMKYIHALTKWIFLGGSPLHVFESTSTTGLAASSGVGTDFSPGVSLTLPTAGEYRTRFGARLGHSANSAEMTVLLAATGLSYATSYQARVQQPAANTAIAASVAITTQYAGISGTLKMQYAAGSSGGFASHKWIEVEPVTLG